MTIAPDLRVATRYAPLPDAASPARVASDGLPSFDPVGPLPGAGVTLLEASAGTGKTHAITSLYLRLVAEEGRTPDRILVVTFTEAATTELRERVRGRLRAARDAFAAAHVAPGTRTGDDVIDHLLAEAARRGEVDAWHGRLRAALERFDDAAISTIHGYCARVLREHAFACGGELGAELLGVPDALLDEVVRDYWDTVVARGLSAEALAVLREQHGISVETLREVAGRAVAHPEARLVPAVAEGTEVGAATARALAEFDAARRVHATVWRDGHEALLAEIDSAVRAKALSGHSWRKTDVPKRVERMARWADAPDLEPVPEPFHFFTSEKLSRDGQLTVTHPLVALGDTLLAARGALDAAAAADAVALKHGCATFARREVARRLRARRQMTYDDLLFGVRDALRDPAHGATVLAALRGAHDVALVDEFQDTDGVQWEIFATAFGEAPDGQVPDRQPRRLVIIGDPKQAIYGFRGADVRTYLRAAGLAYDRGTWRALDTNWRSDAPYVAALNHVFAGHAAPFADARIPYARVHARHGTRLTGAGAPFQVRVLRREGRLRVGPRSGLVPKGAVNACIPSLVAADVVRFLRSGAELVERQGERLVRRDVRPSDVAVLVRTNDQAVAVQRALRAAGVPCVTHGARSVLATTEAAELATVLAAVLEPANAALVRAALATDLLGIVAAAELFADGEPAGAGDALARLDADEAAVERWMERLRVWREQWHGGGRRRVRGGGFARMFRAMLDGLALPARLLALDDGERRLTNLLHLGELLHAESAARALEPGALLAWLRRQGSEDDPQDDTRQLRLESDADAAQVVTMHASKGLEYPVVWCPYLWDGKLARDRDRAHPLYWAEDEGRAERRLHLAPTNDGEEHAAIDDECFAEGLRLLYVALTRARHRCTVWWGAVNEGGTSPLGWLFHGGAAESVRTAREACAGALEAMSDDALRARLDGIAAGSGGTVAVADETFDAPGRWTPPTSARLELTARAFGRTATLDDGWRLGSFTGLTRAAGVRHLPVSLEADVPEAAADARADASNEDAIHDAPHDADAGDDLVPLAAFPASAAAGVFFHEVLESHDAAADAAALEALVGERLDAFGFDREAWTAPVADAVRRVLDAPLAAVDGGPPLRLREVPRERGLAELRFELPACGGLSRRGAEPITPAALARVFEAHPGGTLDAGTLRAYADRVRGLGFRPLRGFLTGAVDLLAEHGGRWWVVDWKSNRLGPRAADYAPARLVEEMTHAHYVLQYHLYLLAAHRWLGWRLPGYDYDRHVGGACYPFLRGVSGAVAPGGASAYGVFVDRPPRARIEALDRLFREGGA